MSLSRKDIRSFLEDETLSTDEKVAKIAKANGESMDSLKDRIAELERQTGRMEEMQTELETLRGQAAEGWKEKYEQEHSDFEAYKDAQTQKEVSKAKVSAYKTLLKENGVSEKRIDSIARLADMDAIQLDKNGKIKDADKMAETIKSEWSDFIVSTQTVGADVVNPPKNDTQGEVMTVEKIMAIKNREEKLKAIRENPGLFKK